jgi:lysophospholipid acyltransferase (LPLAT)-like uncharacterized protein
MDSIMLKRFLKSDAGIFLLSLLASFYIRIVYWTSTWSKKNFHIPKQFLKEGKPFLTCFWHGRLLMLPYGWVGRTMKPKHPFFMLISAHKDGRLISKTVHWFGIKTIAGSTNRGGMEAFREILKKARKGQTIGITPDGPRGPFESVSPGTIKIAELGGMPILPITFSTSRAKIFKSWDRFFLPLPFSKGVIAWGEPIFIDKGSLEESQNKIQNALKDLTKKADLYTKI